MRRGAVALVAGIALAGFALRVHAAAARPNWDGADPATRAWFAEQLVGEGPDALYEATVWAPGHFVVLAASSAFAGRPWGARLPGLLSGLLLPLAAALLARRCGREAHDDGAAVLAAGWAAFDPHAIGLSTVSHAEPLAAAGVLLGAALLDRGRLGTAALLFFAATSFRYEAGAAALLLLAGGGSRLRRFALLALAMSPFWLWAGTRPSFVAWNGFARADFAELIPSFGLGRGAAIADAVAGMIVAAPLPAAAGIAGAVTLLRRRDPLGALPLLAAAVIVTGLDGHVPLPARYMLTAEAAFAALGASWLAGRFAGRRLALVALPALIAAHAASARPAPAPRPPAGLEAAAALLDASLLAGAAGPDARVVIDPRGEAASFLYWRAGVPAGRAAGLHRDDRGDPNMYRHFAELAGGSPAVLVAVDGGEAARFFSLPDDHDVERFDALLRFRGRSGPFSLWAVGPRR
jgi:hypothetical protein